MNIETPEILWVEPSQFPDEWTGTADNRTEFDTPYVKRESVEEVLKELVSYALEADQYWHSNFNFEPYKEHKSIKKAKEFLAKLEKE